MMLNVKLFVLRQPYWKTIITTTFKCSVRSEQQTRHAMHVYSNNEARSCNQCCSGKELSITHSACVFVAFIIQLAMRMRRTIVCDCPSLQYLSALSHKRDD
jgi:hypothetical protein